MAGEVELFYSLVVRHVDLPRQIQVGAVKYDVRVQQRLLSGADNDLRRSLLLGQIQYSMCEISVEKDVSQQIVPEVLMHECIHGILEQGGHRDHPEPLVECLGYGLVALLRQNPDLVAFILGSSYSAVSQGQGA